MLFLPCSPERGVSRQRPQLFFSAPLQALGVSVLVSTYQAGKLIVLRADQQTLDTHFRTFNRPMGLAALGGRLAVGTEHTACEFHNVPAVARKVEPAGTHDACFLPRQIHYTGDVQIHEMAWVEDPRDSGKSELWFVNTRFSCLSTCSATYSFVSRWRPPFISALSPEDRCHLNGLGLCDGVPRFVTALGESDAPAGWRARKRDGGILMDVTTNQVLLRGLSMPHSPRWHDRRLWVLNSGEGGLGWVDLNRGRYESVAELPGFTRGLDFHGRYAFVGLSQIRESAVFSGIAIAERPPEERCCGVWVVDLVSGQTVGFVRFESGVQEIFAVSVLTGVRFPDVITDDARLLGDTFVLPEESLAEVPENLQCRVDPSQGTAPGANEPPAL